MWTARVSRHLSVSYDYDSAVQFDVRMGLDQCCIQQFFMGASFSMKVARRKNVLQLGSQGGGVVGLPL